MKHPDIKTKTEKKIRRKISRGSKIGKYTMGRRHSRARPGRKSGNCCNSCGNTLPSNSIIYTCNKCLDKIPLLTKQQSMAIPSMTKK